MSQLPRKRGRPPKYASKEEKAKEDVRKRRARRHGSSAAGQKAESIQTRDGNQRRSVPPFSELQFHLEPWNHFDAPAEDDGVQSRSPPTTRDKDDFNFHLATRPLSLAGQAQQHPDEVALPARSREMTTTYSPTTDESVQEEICVGFDEDDGNFDIYSPVARPQNGDMSPSSIKDGSAEVVAELHSTASDTIEESAPATEGMLNGPLVEKDGYDGRATEEGNESDYEPQSESAFETDSESESGPPTLDLEDADADIAPGDAVAQPNDFYAKTFLENSWNRQCSCAQEETTWSDGRPVHGLQQMAEYWQGLGVPDAIGTKTVSATTIQGEAPHPEWLSVLSGGDQRPRLCFEKSQNSTPNFARTWDVDSMIIRASCLSIN